MISDTQGKLVATIVKCSEKTKEFLLMWKWVVGAIVLGGVGYLGYDTYRYYQLGGFSMPQTLKGQSAVSFSSGFRGVLPWEKNRDRKYLGYPAEVATVYKESWSICREPDEEERRYFEDQVNMAPGERYEVICEIDADGDVFIRGWVTSVPDI